VRLITVSKPAPWKALFKLKRRTR